MSSTPASRRAALERAHWNVLLLDGAEVDVDLVTDVPRQAMLAEVRDADLARDLGGVHAPALDAAAQAIYGPARYVWGVRGRSVELAMAAALIGKDNIVLANGLFRTTQHALRKHGAELEMEPSSPHRAGSADFDLTWLDLRIADGDVSWVCFESANNALGGWPLSLEHLRKVRALCDRHRVRILVDATRLLSGALVAAPDADPRVYAREVTSLADAFWVSCAKELIAPVGAFLAVRTAEAQKRAFAYMFDEGTWLDGLEPRVRLLAGIEAIGRDPAPLVRRRAQVERLAATLREEGVRILEPAGAHAVYVPIDAELLGGSPARARALEALLFERAGVRVFVQPYPRMGYTAMVRLAVTVEAYSDEQLLGAGRELARLLRDPSGAPRLVEQPDADMVHDMLRAYTLAPG